MNFEKFSKNAILVFTCLSLFATIFVNKDLLFPFITTKAFFFRICLELALPFYVYLLLQKQGLRPDLKQPLNLAILAFLFINIISAIAGVNVLKSFWGNFERMGGVFYLAHLVLLYFYVLMLGQMGGSYIRKFLHVLLFVSAIISLNGISGMLGGPTLTLDPSLPVRTSSTLGNPIFLASYLIFPLFISLFFASQTEKKSAKWLYGILALVQIVGIFQSGTRGAVVGLVLGVFIASVVYLILQKNKRVKIISGIGLLAFVLLAGVLFLNHEKLPQGSTLKRVFNLGDTNTWSRLIQWKIAIKGVGDFPVLGAGPENYYVVGNKYYDNEMYKYDRSWFDKPHNYILEILITNGFLGLLAYLAILVFALWGVFKAFKAGLISLLEACLLLAGMLVYQIQNLFVFDTIPASLMFYSFLGFTGFLFFESMNVESKAVKHNMKPGNGLPLGFVFTSVSAASLLSLYLIVVTNIMPAKASKAVNYGYAYSGVDPYKSFDYFKQAINSSFNFDKTETGAKYIDFATGLVRGEWAQKDAKFVSSQLEAALSYQLQLTQKVNNDPVVMQKLATIYLFQAIFNNTPLALEGLEAAQKAVELAPKRIEARMLLAQLRLYQGFGQEAVKIIEEVIDLDPANKETKWQLAMVYRDMGEIKKSVEAAEAAFNKGYQAAIGADLSWLADFYLTNREFEKAVKLAEKNVQLNPENLKAIALLYTSLKNAGQSDRAEALLDQFNKFKPQLYPELVKLLGL